MWVILPFATFIISFYGFYSRTCNGRLAFLYAAALWGASVFILTETLSICHALSFFPLLIGWSLICAGSIYWARSSIPVVDKKFLGRWMDNWSATEKFLILSIIVLGAIKAFSAVMSAPNTYDGLTYHLSRVEHWIQNQTLANYPTHILRQLYSPPWAEYAILHLRILSSGDYFSNAVQWFSSIGSWVAISCIGQMLGADRKGQLLSVVLAATLPMGLVQSTSTQTDYVMTFWVTGFVYLLWKTYQQKRWSQAFGAGVFLGLALLTKGNAYILTSVWIIIYAMGALYSREGSRLKLLALMVGIALLFNIPYAIRNINTFGTPYWTDVQLTNKNVTMRTFIANVVCNTALHLGTPWERDNKFIERGLHGLAKGMGFDLNNPDPNPGADTFSFQRQSTGEDDAGNCLYLFLLVFGFVLVLLYPPLRRRSYWIYAGAVVLMVIFFCVVVRFHPFNSRYHLAIFVLSCALIGTIFAGLMRHWVGLLVSVVLMCSYPWLLACNEHPFLGNKNIIIRPRGQQYFSERPGMFYPYETVVKSIGLKGCRDIGLIEGGDSMEYPWWVLLRQTYGNQFRYENVDVTNRSASLSYPKGLFDPCVLIASGDDRQVIDLSTGVYVRVWSMDLPQGLTSVFIKARKK
ncbi:MAG: glycosyltransferase family 39 protein [Candidatus Omnitrophica bacterium]|nr:glycosyltransferase family 39 protein [Candidatus Omnitrophota bacterium]